MPLCLCVRVYRILSDKISGRESDLLPQAAYTEIGLGDEVSGISRLSEEQGRAGGCKQPQGQRKEGREDLIEGRVCRKEIGRAERKVHGYW